MADVDTVTLTFTREQVEVVRIALMQRASGQEVYANGSPALNAEQRRALMVEAMGWRDMAILLANDVSPAEAA